MKKKMPPFFHLYYEIIIVVDKFSTVFIIKPQRTNKSKSKE